MVGFLAGLSISMTLYLHYLQRAYLVSCLREHHSLSFIKKMKKGATRMAWFTGFYLLKDGKLRERWLKPALLVINANLFSIVLVMILGLLSCLSVISGGALQKIYAILLFKDMILLLVLFGLASCNTGKTADK